MIRPRQGEPLGPADDMDVIRVFIDNPIHIGIPIAKFVMKGSRNFFLFSILPQHLILPPAEL